MYFNRRFNEMVNRVPAMFPTPRHDNIVISSTGVADRKGYSALVTDHVPNMHLTDTGQCFPLYWYEHVDENEDRPQGEMFADRPTPDADGYIRVFHGLRKRHLQRYLDEFVFRWNRRRNMRGAFDTLLGISVCLAPATYRDFVDQRA